VYFFECPKEVYEDNANPDPALAVTKDRIAFISSHYGDYDIHVMNADGSDQTRLTNNSLHYIGVHSLSEAAWSPE
jgi:Tol biopolymer transport system component